MDINQYRQNCLVKAEMNDVFFEIDNNFNYGQGSSCNLYLMPTELVILPKSNIRWDIVSLKKQDYFDPITLPFNEINEIEEFVESNFLNASQTILIKTNSNKNYFIKQFKIGVATTQRLNLGVFYQSFIQKFNAHKREADTQSPNKVYLAIPPNTALTALKCPACKAPLKFMPPCNCEQCGILIELLR
ncbi:MAG: hypothetical protein ACTSVY_03500 [Candidatus Helarchaeota archaeon]